MKKMVRIAAIFIFQLMLAHSAFGQLDPYGLAGEKITALAIYPRPLSHQVYLCAATDLAGVFARYVDSPDSHWVNIGLVGKRITALYVQNWGVGPAIINTLYAGLQPDKVAGDSTLIYQLTPGASWTAADSGLDAGTIDQISALDGFFFGGHMPPEPIFAGNGGSIYRAIGFPFGLFWQTSWAGSGVQRINVIKVHRDDWWGFGSTIWAGGETGFFAPFLVRSDDQGATWYEFYPPVSGDNACYSIAVDPLHADTVYAGMKGLVMKTTDGGQNWTATALQNVSVNFYGLAINPANPQHLLAGGSTPQNEFALYETKDGGVSWNEILSPGTVAGISAMAADTLGGEFMVYLGTSGSGVYRYRAPLSGMGGRNTNTTADQFRLYQNYPNPFNPQTTIGYTLPRQSRVRLEIFDILGRKIRMLVNRTQGDGKDENGRQMPGGVYLYRLQSEGYSLQRKMLIIR